MGAGRRRDARLGRSTPDWSVARRWDEALLDAIRRALPNPPVHARNLFHTSVAMWDAWAAYDPTATGLHRHREDHGATSTSARDEAISYAAYRVLTARYTKAVGGAESLSEFDRRDGHPCATRSTITTTERRLAGRGGQPDRRGGPGLRSDRRLERGRRLRRPGLQAREPSRWW